MKRFILTGTPGAGKTVLLRQLEQDGFGVVEEAATDVIALQQAQGIAEPWTDPGFHGFEIVPIAAGSVLDRVTEITAEVTPP